MYVYKNVNNVMASVDRKIKVGYVLTLSEFKNRLKRLCGSKKLIKAKNYKVISTPCDECPPSCNCLYCDVKDNIVSKRIITEKS